jgi:hypothetical protein
MLLRRVKTEKGEMSAGNTPMNQVNIAKEGG